MVRRPRYARCQTGSGQRPTCVRTVFDTRPSASEVKKEWLTWSVESEQNRPATRWQSPPCPPHPPGRSSSGALMAGLHRHHHIVFAGLPRQPSLWRGVLMQHYAHHRSVWPHLPVRRALRCPLNQALTMQIPLCHRVTQRVVVPLDQLFMEMPDREAAVGIAIRAQHALDVRHPRPAQRRIQATIRQPDDPAARRRPRQQRNVRSLIPRNSPASIWLDSDYSRRPRTPSKPIRRIPS